MKLTRRDVLRATSAIAGAMGLHATGLLPVQQALAKEGEGAPDVIWLQAQSCTGCSVSVLNSVYYTTIDDVLLNLLDLEFHPTVMAAAGEQAVTATGEAYANGGYVLVVEGAIPMGAEGLYCDLWPEVDLGGGTVIPGGTAAEVVARFMEKAGVVIAVGSCACYGGMAAGHPNPTHARGLPDMYGPRAARRRTIKIPGCPVHPDWVVGTIASLLPPEGQIPELDMFGRPTDYFGRRVHDRCPNRTKEKADMLGQPGCLNSLGCKGPKTGADCPVRLWNAGEHLGAGENWCIGAGGPCLGCTEPTFPDQMSPFYRFPAKTKSGGK